MDLVLFVVSVKRVPVTATKMNHKNHRRQTNEEDGNVATDYIDTLGVVC